MVSACLRIIQYPLWLLRIVIALVCLLMSVSGVRPVFAAAGDLDTSFGTNGVVWTDFDYKSSYYSWPRSVAIQADGKVLVSGITYYSEDGYSGYTAIVLSRYTADGNLDSTFGAGGKAVVPFGSNAETYSMAIQNDGKIVIVATTTLALRFVGGDGFNYFYIIRLNSDGSLDTSFGDNGKTVVKTTEKIHRRAYGVTIQTDGKIVAVGQSYYDYGYHIIAVRLEQDGSIDTSFGTDGIVFLKENSIVSIGKTVAVQEDGKIIIVGNYLGDHFVTIRYNSNGTLDSTFGQNGIIYTQFLDYGGSPIYSASQYVTLQSDGKIIVSGYVNNYFAAVRYNKNGELDSSFGTDGKAIVSDIILFIESADFHPNTIAIQSDDKIVITGAEKNSGKFTAARLTANGQLDTTFGQQGLATIDKYHAGWGYAVAVQPNGRIVATGTMEQGGKIAFAVARLLGDGSPAVTTNDVTVATASTATSGGNVTDGGSASVIERGVCWNTTGTPTVNDAKTSDEAGTGVFTSTLSNLISGSVYYVRAYATNSYGTAYGTQITFTMPAAPTVRVNAAWTNTATSAAAQSDVTNDGGVTVTARGVCWNVTGAPTIIDSKTMDGTGTGVFESSLTDLTASTTYYLRAYATNVTGTAYSDQVSFTTPAAISTPPTVTTAAASSVKSTTASSGGAVISEGSSGVTARGVCWNTTGAPTTSDSKTSDGTGTGVFTSALTGLTASTTYYARAYATNSAGTSYGGQITFTTSKVGVPTLTTTAASSIKATTATSGGNVSDKGDSDVIARGVCWNTTGSPTTSDSKTSDGTGNGAFVSSITGLTANAKYYVRAYATNEQGTAYGDTVSFTAALAPSGKFVIWQNTSSGEIRWWSLSTSGPIISEESGVGYGKVSESTLDGAWRFAGSTTISNYKTLFFQNTSTGYVTYWQLDDSATMVNSGLASESVKVNSGWRAVGVCTVDSTPVILWQNQSSGKVVFWKIGTDCKLTSEVKDTGWGFVSDTLTVNSAWRLAGITEIDGVKILVWQNQNTGKVVWWRLTGEMKLLNANKEGGWGFVSDNLTLNSNWSLAGVTSGQKLVWQNQGTGKVAWWGLGGNYKLPNETKNSGWGFVSDNLTVGSAWSLGGLTELDSILTFIWSNTTSGYAAYWKINSSNQLQNETRNDGWGLISNNLTMKASDNWRMCGVTP
jgi:uncharacterized delta-60 repeat protein